MKQEIIVLIFVYLCKFILEIPGVFFHSLLSKGDTGLMGAIKYLMNTYEASQGEEEIVVHYQCKPIWTTSSVLTDNCIVSFFTIVIAAWSAFYLFLNSCVKHKYCLQHVIQNPVRT